MAYLPRIMGITFKGIALLLLTSVCASAQPPALREMVDAEKAFIEMAKTQNRRDAFLFFLSDSSITQGPQGPIKGKARIEAQTVTEDWLFWEVAYSDLASSGDFGFNSGPWYYRPRRTDEKWVAFGEFNSVWKKQPDGSWKNVLDIGISHGPASEPINWTFSQIAAGKPGTKHGKATAAEVEFQQALQKDPANAYRKFVSSEARMMVTGNLPFRGLDMIGNYLAACPAQKNRLVLGSDTASSGDMGYVYGTVDVTVTKETKPEVKKATFVRIWKREGDAWKIVLDVLTYNP